MRPLFQLVKKISPRAVLQLFFNAYSPPLRIPYSRLDKGSAVGSDGPIVLEYFPDYLRQLLRPHPTTPPFPLRLLFFFDDVFSVQSSDVVRNALFTWPLLRRCGSSPAWTPCFQARVQHRNRQSPSAGPLSNHISLLSPTSSLSFLAGMAERTLPSKSAAIKFSRNWFLKNSRKTIIGSPLCWHTFSFYSAQPF